MDELNIIHEFGYKNNPNSQAYVESFHSSVQCEFVESIEFNYIDDVYNYYISYIYFYNRPHGSLYYFTPDFVFNLFSDQYNNSDLEEFKSIKFNDFIVCKCFPYFFSNSQGASRSLTTKKNMIN
ncbi:integrase core domain-containing protein [Marinitoga sp. 38H-ov]|uniref:integrase core domain-containing protein n=1 Tax=Marinitoga sp. 38H-ov TaxID=1755814 RepID=UPI0013EA6EA1|nr:integrase core domain-containing protein [Marinitoga sp. 38H-ov]